MVEQTEGSPLDEFRWIIPRIIGNGASMGDVMAVFATATDHESWYAEWTKYAEMYQESAAHAGARGMTVTQRDHLIIACNYYRTAQFIINKESSEKTSLLENSIRCYVEAGKLFNPPIERIEIPFRGTTLPGYFRPAGTAEKPTPAVLLMHGADSTKEEGHFIFQTYWDRGIATIGFDGPGQAESRTRGLYLDFDAYPEACAAALDYLEKRPEVRADKVAVWGQCMGAHMAVRAAAAEKRFKACVWLSGFYDLDVWMADHIPAPVKRNLMYTMGLKTLDALKEKAHSVTLRGIAEKVECPILLIQSTGDWQTPPREAELTYADVRGPREIKIYDGSVHCCSDIIPRVRPFMADWIKMKLDAA